VEEMGDRTEELKGRVGELDSMHDDWLRKMQLAFGRMLVKSCRFGDARWFIAGPFSRLSSYYMVERGMCGVERGVKKDAVDIATEWLKIPTFIRMPYRIAQATDDKVTIEWDECAVGFTEPSCLQACETACEIDVAAVRRLGGRLSVTENMLKGAPRCVFEITKLP
jgi:hypothetical protein